MNVAEWCLALGFRDAGIMFLALALMSEQPLSKKWRTYLVYSASYVLITWLLREIGILSVWLPLVECVAIIWSIYRLLGFSLKRSFGVYGVLVLEYFLYDLIVWLYLSLLD